MSTQNLDSPYRKSAHPSTPNSPLEAAPSLGHEIRVLEDGRTVLEKDVVIPMRDGVKLYANVFRPAENVTATSPTLVFFAPFGKHGAVPRERFSNMGVDFSKLSAYAYWELPDPLLWVGQWNYSFALVDPRGTWWSEGDAAHYISPEEGRDGYDVVEWIAQQTWSTGKVGWGAVSYYAMSAYQTAVLQPPHLAAIMPWEGISDIYREVNTQGGIPNVAFQQLWMNMTGTGLGLSEDHATLTLEHPLLDELWESKVVDWSKINIPAFSVTGWSSLGLHLRGTIRAWNNFSSTKKYLLIHSGKEWAEYYNDANVLKQKAFFDRFLKDKPNEVDTWPPVTLDVRTSLETSTRRSATSFPPPNTTLTPFYLGPANALTTQNTSTEPAAFASYTAHHANSSVSFSHTFATRTEITGHASARLHIQALAYPDADLFLALQKVAPNGSEVRFWHSTQKAEASASFGWLRASHRELDGTRSTQGLPVHLHRRRQWLTPTEIVEVEVELWPSSTVWEAGETMRLVVRGSAFTDEEDATQFKGDRHGFGEVRLWFGGGYESQLLVPVCGGE